MKFFTDFYDDLKWVFKFCEDRIALYPECLKNPGMKYLAHYNVFNEEAAKNYICYLLPFWVGYGLAIRRDLCRKISAANTFMMLFAFIQDDLIDEDIKTGDKAELLSLNNLFFTDFIELYRELFASDSDFWIYFKVHMNKWTSSVASESKNFNDFFDLFDERCISLVSGKAELVKLAAVAVCVLSERVSCLNTFTEIIDRTLLSLQMEDDYADWKKDLINGSANILLHEAMKETGISNIRYLKEAQVKRELLFGGILDKLVTVLKENLKRLEEIRIEANPYFVEFNLHLLSYMEKEALCYRERRRAIKLGGLFNWIEKNGIKNQ